MKRAVFGFVLILSVFLFFACGGTPPPAKPPEPDKVSDPAPATPAPVATPASPSRSTDLVLDGAETYTVVKGDTLSDIARRKYQDGFYWPLIMMASTSAWTNLGMALDQDLIEPGMVLTIPRLQANLNDSRAKQSMKRYFLDTASTTNQKRPKDAEGLRKLADQW
jgi:Tfp pilus assembly protein FimV